MRQSAAPISTLILSGFITTSVAQTPSTPPPVTGYVQLPHDLSPWGMFLGADLVVKGVLIGLAIASVMTWTIALVKLFEAWRLSRQTRAGLVHLRSSSSLTEAQERLASRSSAVRRLVNAAIDEVVKSGPSLTADGIKERIVIELGRIESAEARRMSRGTGLLATIGAVGPFVGLFGTVWGIMNSFVGIAKAHTTNLAVVAPGIAEALLATAIGLAAAIPAVVVYNFLGRLAAGQKARVADASAEVMRTVSRDLDRTASVAPDISRRPAASRAAE